MREAMREAMRADDRVFLMGEDVGSYGGCFAVSLGLLEEFGPERIRDTPLSESAFVGAGIGAAIGGMRPIVEIMTVNFSLLALDQILNNAASLLHMSGGQFNVPLVIRMTTGAGRQLAAQHSHSLEGWYAHIPGLRVLAPATLEDARGMLATALADPDPVLIFEHGTLYNLKGELAEDAGAVDIDRAAVRRAGDDVTVIAYGGCVAQGADRRRAAGGRRHLGRGDRPAHAPAAGRRDDPGVGTPYPRAPSSSTRAGAAAASPPRSARGSPSRRSTSSTPPWSGSAPPRSRCPTRDTSRRRRCRSPRRSRPPRGAPGRVDERLHDAVAGRGHGRGHAAGVAGQARGQRAQGRHPRGRRHLQGGRRGRELRRRRGAGPRRRARHQGPGRGGAGHHGPAGCRAGSAGRCGARTGTGPAPAPTPPSAPVAAPSRTHPTPRT